MVGQVTKFVDDVAWQLGRQFLTLSYFQHFLEETKLTGHVNLSTLQQENSNVCFVPRGKVSDWTKERKNMPHISSSRPVEVVSYHFYFRT